MDNEISLAMKTLRTFVAALLIFGCVVEAPMAAGVADAPNPHWKSDLGWAFVGTMSNSFGVLAAVAISGTNPVLGAVIGLKCVYGTYTNLTNMVLVAGDKYPRSTGSFLNDFARWKFPGSKTAQTVASVLDFALDAWALMAWRPISTALKMGRPIDPLLGKFIASNRIGWYIRTEMFRATTAFQLQLLMWVQGAKIGMEGYGLWKEHKEMARLKSQPPPVVMSAQMPAMQANTGSAAVTAARAPMSAAMPLAQAAAPVASAQMPPATAQIPPGTAAPPVPPPPAVFGPGCGAGYHREQGECIENGGGTPTGPAQIPTSVPGPGPFNN